MKRATALVTAAVALAASAAPADAHGLRATVSVEMRINSLRAAHGCGPLRVHMGLERAAARQAREDLAWGAGRFSRPHSIVRAWMRSPEHRMVLMDCRFSQLGIGIAAGRFGRHPYALVYTADLAA